MYYQHDNFLLEQRTCQENVCIETVSSAPEQKTAIYIDNVRVKNSEGLIKVELIHEDGYTLEFLTNHSSDMVEQMKGFIFQCLSFRHLNRYVRIIGKRLFNCVPALPNLNPYTTIHIDSNVYTVIRFGPYILTSMRMLFSCCISLNRAFSQTLYSELIAC